MISALLAEFLPWALGIAAAALGLWGYGRSKKKEGRAEAETDALKDTHKRMEAGRDAANDLRGADRDKLIDRLRDNDTRW